MRIFLSYSRRDTATADGMVIALEAHGFDVLIDRQDLPYGEEWQPQLAAMIRQCDTIVWLASQASVTSRWCSWELGEAQRLGKRLIPVRISPLAPEDLPEVLGRIHVLPVEGVYDSSLHLADLVRAIETDRAWMETHTRLADRATEWIGRGRRTDRLLRGRALRDAEEWLAGRPERASAPGPEIVELLQQSRRAATRSLRVLVALAAVGFVAMSGLAGFALLQWDRADKQTIVAQNNEDEANTQRDIARRNEDEATKQRELAEQREQEAIAQRNIARSNEYRSLGNLAQVAYTNGRWLDSAKLALASWPRNADDPAVRTEKSLLALQAAINGTVALTTDIALPPGTVFRTNDDLSRVLSLSPLRNGPSQTEGATVRLWNAATGEEIGPQMTAAIDAGWGVFIAGGTQIVTGASSGDIQIWDAATGLLVRRLMGGGGRPRYLQPFDEDRKLAVLLPSPYDPIVEDAYILDMETGEQIGEPFYEATGFVLGEPDWFGVVTDYATQIVDPVTGIPTGDAFAGRDLSYVDFNEKANVLLTLAGSLDLSNLSDWSYRCTIPGVSKGRALAPDGMTVLTWFENNDVTVWDARDCSPIATTTTFTILGDPVYSSDGRYFWTMWSKELSRFDARTGLLDLHVELPLAGTGFRMSPGGRQIAILHHSTDGSKVFLVDTETGVSGDSIPLDDLDEVAFSEDGSRLLAWSEFGRVFQFDAASGAPLSARMRNPDAITDATFARDGKHVLTTSRDGIFRIWDLDKYAPQVSPLWIKGAPEPYAVAVKGECVAVLHVDDKLSLWRGTNLVWGEVQLQQYAGLVEINADCSRVATRSRRLLQLWNGADGSPASASFDEADQIEEIKFSPDGTRLAERMTGGRIVLRNAVDGQEIGLQLAGFPKEVSGLVFSPDSMRLLVWSAEKDLAWQWDTATGKTIGDAMSFKAPDAAAYSGDGSKILVRSSNTGSVGTWDANGAVGPMLQHTSGVWTADFTADGENVVVWTYDGIAHWWSLSAPQTPIVHSHGLKNISMYALGGAVASRDNRQVLSWTDEDNSIHLWNTSTGKLAAPAIVFEGVREARFTPDGKRLVAWSDTAVRVYDAAATLRLSFTMPDFTYGHVDAVDVADDHVLVTSRSGAVVIRTRYDIPPGGFIEAACSLLGDTSLGSPNVRFALDLADPICTPEQAAIPLNWDEIERMPAR